MIGIQESQKSESVLNAKVHIGTKKKLTQKRLNALLKYDTETGLFTWKAAKAFNVRPGQVAGCPGSHGYQQIKIDRNLYLAHRLVWLYIHGYFPEGHIDHINRDILDNRIENLRVVSQSCNMRNVKTSISNTSGIRGVSRFKQSGKWSAQITINYKQSGLGLYKEFCNAVCARLAAEQCLGWSGCDSSSPAFQYVKKNIIKKGK